MDNGKMPKNAKIFECENCHFKCSKQSNYIKHISTDKHNRIINGNEMITQNAEQYSCDRCSSTYKYKSGLCRHIKKCQISTETNPEIETQIEIYNTSIPSENMIIPKVRT